MKKIIILALAALFVLFAVSCAATSDKLAVTDMERPEGGMSGGVAYPAAEPNYAADTIAKDESAAYAPNAESAPAVSIYNPANTSADKIVYSANASIETLDFDASVAALEELIAEYGGFIETSHVYGNPVTIYQEDYYRSDAAPYRTANYTLRVPAEVFESVKTSLERLGNVISLSTSAMNITAQYTDTESRLRMYRTEEESLLAMLAKADTVSDMILIEQRLSEVRYNIEWLTSSMRDMDNRVNYSAVSLYIREVERLTEKTEPNRSYLQQIADGLKNTLAAIGRFFKNMVKYFIIYIPIIAIIVILFIIFYAAGKRLKVKNRERKVNKIIMKNETDETDE